MTWNEMFGFPNDVESLKKAYKELAKRYHPDVNPDGADKFQEVTALYNEALKILGEANKLIIDTLNGSHLECSYIGKYAVGRENIYISDDSIIIEFTGDTRSKFYDDFLNVTSDIKFSTPELEAAFKFIKNRHLTVCKTADNNYIIQKRGNLLPLRLVIESDEFKHDADRYRHYVWMLNRIFAFACLMNDSELSFNGFDIDNIFVDMEKHILHFVNGFQYCCKLGNKLGALPRFVYEYVSVKTKQDGLCNASIDVESILAIGRVFFDTSAPKELRDFCYNTVAVKSPLEAWKSFEETFKSVYTERKFITYNMNKLSNWKSMLK